MELDHLIGMEVEAVNRTGDLCRISFPHRTLVFSSGGAVAGLTGWVLSAVQKSAEQVTLKFIRGSGSLTSKDVVIVGDYEIRASKAQPRASNQDMEQEIDEARPDDPSQLRDKGGPTPEEDDE